MSTHKSDLNWGKYIEKTKDYRISSRSARWYVKRVEDYTKSHPDLPLLEHSSETVENYLRKLSHNTHLADWQFKQAVEAIRILFVDCIHPQWAIKFPWSYWIDASKQLSPAHATIARDYTPSPQNAATFSSSQDNFITPVASDDGLVKKVSEIFPEIFSKTIQHLRTNHYSIRTEQAYVHWLARYIAFHKMQDPTNLDGLGIKRFLEYLVVQRHVSSNTQGQALCALVYFYKQVLGVEIGDFSDFIRSKKPRRIPVVLLPAEVSNLLSEIDNTTYRLMADLLYGCGLRLLECIRLRVFDVDFGYQQIVIRNAKGGKDRFLLLQNLHTPHPCG